MYTELPLNLLPGQTGSIRFRLASGQLSAGLSAALLSPADDTISASCSDDEVLIPRLEDPGLYLLEIRSSGKTILYCHLSVLPGATSPTILGAAAAPEPLALITLSSTPGPQGETGDKGAPGRDGTDGIDGTDGKDGPTPGEVLSALEPYIPAFDTATQTGTSNATALWLQLSSPPAGPLLRLDVQCRSNKIDSMSTSPLYLAIWQQSADGADWELLGISRDTATQAPGKPSEWAFEALSLSGRPIRLLPCEERSSSWQPGPVLGIRCSPSTDGSYVTTEKGSRLNYVPQVSFRTAFMSIGQDGSPGVKGDPGPAGDPGRDGIDGKNGTDGTDGKDGSGFFGTEGCPPSMSDLYEAAAYLPYVKQVLRESLRIQNKLILSFAPGISEIYLPIFANIDPVSGSKLWDTLCENLFTDILWDDGSSDSLSAQQPYLHHSFADASQPHSVTITGECSFAIAQEHAHLFSALDYLTDIQLFGVSPLRYVDLSAISPSGLPMSRLSLSRPWHTLFANVDAQYYSKIFANIDLWASGGTIPLSYFAAAPQTSSRYTISLYAPERLAGFLPALWEDIYSRFSSANKPFAGCSAAANYSAAKKHGFA